MGRHHMPVPARRLALLPCKPSHHFLPGWRSLSASPVPPDSCAPADCSSPIPASTGLHASCVCQLLSFSSSSHTCLRLQALPVELDGKQGPAVVEVSPLAEGCLCKAAHMIITTQLQPGRCLQPVLPLGLQIVALAKVSWLTACGTWQHCCCS